MNLNIDIEFLLQIFVYVVSLGVMFGKLSGRMDQHDYKIDKLEQSQNDKLSQLEKNHSEKIERLEKKQDKHNQLIERIYGVEQNVAVFKTEKDAVIQKINTLEHEINELQMSELKNHHDYSNDNKN